MRSVARPAAFAPIRAARPAFTRATTTRAFAKIAAYVTEEKGAKDTLEYRIHFKQNGKHISCWHEIPLFAPSGNLHFICEIPKETSAKMEVATDEQATPIKQDTKKGKLRFYPYNINWNYGLLPQVCTALYCHAIPVKLSDYCCCDGHLLLAAAAFDACQWCIVDYWYATVWRVHCTCRSVLTADGAAAQAVRWLNYKAINISHSSQ